MSQTPVVVDAVRTPQGKEDGVYADVRSEDLSVPLINQLLATTGIESGQVDDLLWGCAQQRNEQGNNLARVVPCIPATSAGTRRYLAPDHSFPLGYAGNPDK